MQLEQLLKQIHAPDQTAMSAAKARWDRIAKPLGSLGLLEDAVVKIAGATGSARVLLARRGVVILCADNGVVAEGVTQTGQEVTAVVAENFTRGATSVCAMARAARCEVFPVDLGVAREISGEGLIIHKIAHGTGNIAREPAMTREQALDAICFGASLVKKYKENGYDILATGEMGIGNTTTSSAVVSVLLERAPREMTGRGAGLDSDGLTRKIRAIERALTLNRPDPADPVDVLAKVGGFDLAGLCGVFLGGAAYRIPILVDGFISAAGALAAMKLCPTVAGYLLASHLSNEPAAKLVMNALGLHPLITAGMCLGEGTGAVAALPLLDLALAVYNEMSTFQEIHIDAYHPFTEYEND